MPKLTPLSKRVIVCSDNRPLNACIDKPNCTFLGHRSDQPFTAFFIWEKFFLHYGEQIKRFVEFGCDQGNTSVYFLLQCINNQAEFRGYDKRRKGVYTNTPVKRKLGLAKRMKIGNGYKMFPEIKTFVRQSGMSVIFTDCIDKPVEFENFAPMLKTGDVLAVHDWDRAIKDEWVRNTLIDLKPFTLLYERERLHMSTLTRFFLKGGR